MLIFVSPECVEGTPTKHGVRNLVRAHFGGYGSLDSRQGCGSHASAAMNKHLVHTACSLKGEGLSAPQLITKARRGLCMRRAGSAQTRSSDAQPGRRNRPSSEARCHESRCHTRTCVWVVDCVLRPSVLDPTVQARVDHAQPLHLRGGPAPPERECARHNDEPDSRVHDCESETW